MAENKNIAPIKLEFLIAIVHNSKQAYFSSIIQSQQANLQFTVPCKGTTHFILQYLGMTDRPKTMITAVIREDEAEEIIARFNEQFQKGGDYKGVVFTVPFSSMVGALAYGFLSNEQQVKTI